MSNCAFSRVLKSWIFPKDPSFPVLTEGSWGPMIQSSKQMAGDLAQPGNLGDKGSELRVLHLGTRGKDMPASAAGDVLGADLQLSPQATGTSLSTKASAELGGIRELMLDRAGHNKHPIASPPDPLQARQTYTAAHPLASTHVSHSGLNACAHSHRAGRTYVGTLAVSWQ